MNSNSETFLKLMATLKPGEASNSVADRIVLMLSALGSKTSTWNVKEWSEASCMIGSLKPSETRAIRKSLWLLTDVIGKIGSR